MHGLSGQETVPIIQQLKHGAPGIRERFGVKKIGIFGSFARGDQTSKSDVDILVELKTEYKTLKNFVALADYLESLFNRKVDLITVEGIDPYIRSRVEAEVIWVEG
ncbi:MAG TPA: nucleotidyltransferase family protein [Methanospirillum sp.]|nr:nucleotidyltransferase family protein [Methanospirillum sp.]